MSYDFLELASREVKDFEDIDPVMRDHYQAEDSVRCEEYIVRGIRACKWLIRTEEMLRDAVVDGLIELDKDTRNIISLLLSRWLAACNHGEEWINRVSNNGYSVANINEFRDCHSKIQDRIDQNEYYEMSQSAVKARFDVETW